MSDNGFQPITHEAELEQRIALHPALAVWFFSSKCEICSSLKPRLERFFTDSFPRMSLAEVACAALPQTAAAHSVFSVPTLIVYLEGRASLRATRHIPLATLGPRLQRSYDLLFS
ncbi:MAG: thioredoxin family protein [Gammaproteobacteria bacterium]|nr:thioredoxin family protein [Gammaproteobacteria bacterium]